MKNQTTTGSAPTADKAQIDIMWDCSSVADPTPEAVREPISREQALRNLPTNDEGENFSGEMLADVDRLNAIRRGEDAGVAAELAANPWLTKEIIVAGLERSEATLLKAGFVLTKPNGPAPCPAPCPAPGTPLPWQVCPEQADAIIIDCDDGFTRLVAECAGSAEDATYIVAAANAYPALVAEVSALRAALEEALDMCRDLRLVASKGKRDEDLPRMAALRALLAQGQEGGAQ